MLSIIIVNYNAGHYLENCLKSIYAETKKIPFDIWVVDNNSKDASVSMVQRNFPEVNLIENKENAGFAGANNNAICKCTGDCVLLLNPDTLVLENAIEKMVKFMDENPQTGNAGCKVLNEDRTLQLACRRSIPSPGVAFSALPAWASYSPTAKEWQNTI